MYAHDRTSYGATVRVSHTHARTYAHTFIHVLMKTICSVKCELAVGRGKRVNRAGGKPRHMYWSAHSHTHTLSMGSSKYGVEKDSNILHADRPSDGSIINL